MEIKYTDRTQLKEYFRKNKIPKETDFSEFIDASLNQREDGLVKMPGDPLSIEAVGDKTSVQKLMNFYRKLSDPAPTWSFNLNDQNANGDLLLGLNIISQGKGRLFIDEVSGQVGIGTSQPAGKLNVINKSEDADGGSIVIGVTTGSNLRFGYHDDYSWIQSHGAKPLSINPIGNNVGISTTSPQKKLHIENGELRVRANHNDITADIGTFFAQNLTQGIGIGYNKIEAIGSVPDQDINIVPKGNGIVSTQGVAFDYNRTTHINRDGALYRFAGQAYLSVDDNLYIKDANSANIPFHFSLNNGLGIGVVNPQKKLHIETGELRVRASHNNITADIGAFYAQNLTQGIGIGYNRIEAIGSNPDQHIVISPKGVNGKILVRDKTSLTFRRYASRGDNLNLNTGVSVADYTAAIVGFIAAGGDIDEGGASGVAIIQVYMYINASTGTWWIRADFKTHNVGENWTVDVMFAANELCSRDGY